MPNTRRTSRPPNKTHQRPAHWDPREIKEAFVFWLGFEALLNLLNMCGFELFCWLREAMEHELVPGFMMAVVMFVVYTPPSRYGLVLSATKSYGFQLGQTILKLRVEQILKFLVGHHMRTVLLWAGGTACIHLTVGCAKSAFPHHPQPPVLSVPVGNVPQRKTTPPTSSNAPDPAALVSSNDSEIKRYE